MQVIYNIFDQSPEGGLFPLCLEKGVGVLARVPLDEGALTGNITEQSTFPPGDFRERYFRGDRKKQVEEHVYALKKDLGGASTVRCRRSRCAIAFTDLAVSTVIPGMRSIKNVEANCAASDAGVLPLDVIAILKRHAWVKDFYNASFK